MTIGIWAALAAATPAALSLPPPALAASTVTLPANTEVRMKTLRELSSLRAKQGERIDLEVVDDVEASGIVVIPKGTRGIGEVSRVSAKGMLGRSGKLEIRALFVELGGHRIRVDGRSDDSGTSGAAGVAGAAILAGAMGAFVTGTSAVIPAGTPIAGYVYKDVVLAIQH